MNAARQLLAGGTALIMTGLSSAWSLGGEASLFLIAQQGQAVTVTKETKSYIVEILVTVALFGLTLFVICKSSRRV
jgi:hypothetical protein